MQTLRVGVAGLRRGRVFVNQFQALPETQITALCDPVPERLRETRDSLPDPDAVQTFPNFEDMLAAPLDIIVVATPAPDHARQACAAMEAGKHVLSEVPADLTLEGCRRLVQTTRATGRCYMLAENCCYWGYVREYRRQVRAGRLGQVLYAEAEYLHDVRDLFLENPCLPPETPFQERLNHPQTRKTWRATLHPIQYLTHDLGPLLDILDDRCVSVCAMAAAPACGPDFAPAAEVALFRTAAGRVIKFLAEFSMPRPAHHWFHLMGTRGSIEAPRGPASKHRLYVEGENMETWSEMAWSTRLLAGPREAWQSGHGGADWHISREFTSAVLAGTPPPIDVFRALDFTLPGIFAVQSIENGGKPVTIPDPRDF